MTAVRIGPCRIADEHGTHEPDEQIDNPSAPLLALAEGKTLDPDSGLQYAYVLGTPPSPEPTPPSPKPEPTPPVDTEQAQ